MSASLVGSEMCIRDRARLARRPWRSVGVAGPAQIAGHRGPCVFVGWQCPVSYTHLTLPTICSV
eukprot:1251316-Alexandrium_andersonii.AAC.1